MHNLLILSKRASDYSSLIDAFDLPDLRIAASSSDVSAARDGGAGCDLALCDPALLAAALPDLPRLRWAQSTWAGIETLLDPGLRRDYILTNACGVFGRLITEYVFGYLLTIERAILERHASQLARRWDPAPPGTLRGKRLGLLGVGSIGSAIAETAKHFGMAVKGFTRRSEESPHVDEYFHDRGQAARFAGDLDYLVCIMPSTGDTRRFVDDEFIRALPAHAVLVNPGRGSTVDADAVAAALREGRLRAAVLDVFDEEPLPAGHELWSSPNVLITSHTAALSNPRDIAAIFETNYRRFVRGEPLTCRVDFARGY
jgi:phosphoglycerate dehydrogenase-like enzyme